MSCSAMPLLDALNINALRRSEDAILEASNHLLVNSRRRSIYLKDPRLQEVHERRRLRQQNAEAQKQLEAIAECESLPTLLKPGGPQSSRANVQESCPVDSEEKSSPPAPSKKAAQPQKSKLTVTPQKAEQESTEKPKPKAKTKSESKGKGKGWTSKQQSAKMGRKRCNFPSSATEDWQSVFPEGAEGYWQMQHEQPGFPYTHNQVAEAWHADHRYEQYAQLGEWSAHNYERLSPSGYHKSTPQVQHLQLQQLQLRQLQQEMELLYPATTSFPAGTVAQFVETGASAGERADSDNSMARHKAYLEKLVERRAERAGA